MHHAHLVGKFERFSGLDAESGDRAEELSGLGSLERGEGGDGGGVSGRAVVE
jgi:hypothetical protein